MNLYNRLGSPLFSRALITAFTIFCLGCGGGGGGNDVVAQAPAGAVPVAAQPTIPPGGGTVVVPTVQAQTFNFPTFSVNSRLAVIANFQTTTETPATTGTLTTTLGNLGAIPRLLSRFDPSSTDGTQDTNACGYADVCALNHLLGDSEVKQQAAATTVRPRFQELAEGTQQDFFVVPAFRDITAEKILEPNETQHCTIFAEVLNGNPIIDRNKALAVAEAFDSNNPERPGSGIYDQVRAVFGSEWNQNPPGGNDGDSKIVIFFFSSQTLGNGLFGFVSPADGNPSGGGNSNKGEILYINGDKSTYQTLATISHEFQHLVNQNEKLNQQGANPAGAVDENIMVNEGLSGLAEEVCGFTLQSGNTLLAAVTNDYLEKPERHEFFDFFESGLAYGQGYLFFKYVREHHGDQVIRAICTNPGSGLANLNNHLPNGFPETFRRWTIANYATNLTGQVPGIYRYPSGFRTNGTFPAGTLVGVNTTSMTNNQANSTNALRPWSCSYQILESKPGSGLSTRIEPAGGSPFGVIFEGTRDQFTSFDE